MKAILDFSVSFLFLFVCSLLTSPAAVAQRPEDIRPILSAEFEGQCSEDLVMYLDKYMAELTGHPAAVGYVVFRGVDDGQEGKNLLFFETVKSHFKARGFDTNRLEFRRAEDGEQQNIKLWVVPPGADPPNLDKPFAAEPIKSTMRFDVAWATWYKHDILGWTIHGFPFLDWGCGADVNSRAFAEVLKAQPNLTGYLVVYVKPGKSKSHAKKVTDFALKELVKEFGIPKARLRTMFGGTRPEPQLELWLVPKGGGIPVIDSN